MRGKKMEAAAETVLTRTFRAWPSDNYAKFVITPGGFLKADLPARLSGLSGWNSVSTDFTRIKTAAELTVRRVVTNRVLTSAKGKADYLTIGIDLNGPTGLHAELVALIRCADGRILRWTGKSYPTVHQEKTLIQVQDLESHCIRVRGERVLILGCHDLNMFNPRGWHNQNKKSKRRQRCEAMRTVASKFQPTVILQHPHFTDSPRTWLLPWRYLETEFDSTLDDCASGICFYRERGERSGLTKVLSSTRHTGGGLEFVFKTRGKKIVGPELL